MLDMKVNLSLVLGDLLLYLSGILFWFSDQFSHSLGVEGFFNRFFAGVFSFLIGGLITIVILRTS
jgi:hypothetical protein